jgi:putative restriction endonuclease
MSRERWLGKLTKLNKARNNAPHKPLLLLVFLELVERGDFPGGRLPLTAELAYRFDTFFNVVQHRRTAKPDVRMPFHHLKSDGFWSAHMASGDISEHRATTAYVVPDPEFVEACRNPEFRRDARTILIAKHFEPAERNALYHLVGIEIPQHDLITREAFFDMERDAEDAGRSARFRLDIVSAYNYTCALTGYRVTTISSGAIVDAAHIHQFANSRNNDPKNGLALCKNAHWQFDVGLWTIDDEYRVLVAKEAFSESSPNQKSLVEMAGQRLLLPTYEAVWPAQVHLSWHRSHKFLGSV